MGTATSINDDAKNREVPLSLLKACMEYYATLNLSFDEYHAYECFMISKPTFVNFTFTDYGTYFKTTSCDPYLNTTLSNRDLLKVSHYESKSCVILSEEDYKLFVSAKNRCTNVK